MFLGRILSILKTSWKVSDLDNQMLTHVCLSHLQLLYSATVTINHCYNSPEAVYILTTQMKEAGMLFEEESDVAS